MDGHGLFLPDVTSLREHLETAFPRQWFVEVSDLILFSFHSFAFCYSSASWEGDLIKKEITSWEAGYPMTILRMKRGGHRQCQSHLYNFEVNVPREAQEKSNAPQGPARTGAVQTYRHACVTVPDLAPVVWW